MRALALIFSMFFCPGLLLAQEQGHPGVSPQSILKKTMEGPTLLILNVIGGEGVSKDVAGMLTELVLDECSKPKKFDVVGRSDLENVLSAEQKKQLEECAGIACVSSVVSSAGVHYYIDSRAGQAGDGFVITVMLIDVKKAAVVKSSTRKVKSEVDLANVIGVMAGELLSAVVIEYPAAASDIVLPAKQVKSTEVKATQVPANVAEVPKAADGGTVQKKQASVAKPSRVETAQKSGFGHDGQASLTLRAYVNDKLDGGAFDVGAGFALSDWFEPSIAVGVGHYLNIKPRATFYVYNLNGAWKPYVFVHSMIFPDPFSAGLGVGAGILYDFHRYFGALFEVPVEYFFKTPSNRESATVLLTLGIQARL